ncbi:MAG: DUF2147 domain-containing protein [Elusimicrobia bacterium]|nr:DUF2147 domain-containing protein [Elusimicrobiota bacterium]
MKKLSLLAAVVLAAQTASAAVDANAILGMWKAENGNVIRIAKNGDVYSGTLEQLVNPDAVHKDLRSPGASIMRGMKFKPGLTSSGALAGKEYGWSGGQVVKANSKKASIENEWYDGYAYVEGRTLYLQGCYGLCDHKVYTKVD